ncbi:hypothetical protein D3C73_777740 [compost metagenome]
MVMYWHKTLLKDPAKGEKQEISQVRIILKLRSALKIWRKCCSTRWSFHTLKKKTKKKWNPYRSDLTTFARKDSCPTSIRKERFWKIFGATQLPAHLAFTAYRLTIFAIKLGRILKSPNPMQ